MTKKTGLLTFAGNTISCNGKVKKLIERGSDPLLISEYRRLTKNGKLDHVEAVARLRSATWKGKSVADILQEVASD